jgi:hypothetical protein
MNIVFIKGAGKFDQMQTIRPGHSPEAIDCPKQGIIPHDMVHYAVEHTLDVRGFLARVREGEVADFQMQGEPLSDAVERLVEVVQGDGWSGGQSPAADLIEMYRVTCDARACPMLEIDEADIAAVRATIADLSARWEALPVGGRLELGFSPAPG